MSVVFRITLLCTNKNLKKFTSVSNFQISNDEKETEKVIICRGGSRFLNLGGGLIQKFSIQISANYSKEASFL